MNRFRPAARAVFIAATISGCAHDVVLPDESAGAVCGDGVVQNGEACDTQSGGCAECRVVPTWACPANHCAPICGDPVDGVVGDAPGCQNPRKDTDCDMTGYWMSRETAFSRDTVIGAVQSTSAWALYRFSQSGDVFQVEEHLACGNHSSGSATIDPTSGALRGFLAHNHQDPTGLHGPRKGTFKPLSGACSFSFDRWYEIHGATEDLLPADFSQHPDLASLPKLPSESDPVHPTKQSLTGAIDFDGDGTLGFGALVTGVASGTRYMVGRQWVEFATTPGKLIPPKSLTLIAAGAWDLQESVISVTDCGTACALIAAGAYAAKDLATRTTLVFLGRSLASPRVASVVQAAPRKDVTTDLATCARVRSALPHETSLTPP